MWKLDGLSGTTTFDGLSVCVNLRRPDLGLIVDLPTEKTAHLLGVDIAPVGQADPEPIVDAYVRGRDLVATYSQTDARTIQPQVYWRQWSGRDGAPEGFELIVSAQTSLLASRPRLDVVTRIPAVSEILALAPHDHGEAAHLTGNTKTREPLLLIRGAIPGRSLVLAAFPSDLVAFTIEANPAFKGDTNFSATLFPESLEKGVIRRGRVGLFLVSRTDDATFAREVFDRFVAQPLPLTA